MIIIHHVESTATEFTGVLRAACRTFNKITTGIQKTSNLQLLEIDGSGSLAFLFFREIDQFTHMDTFLRRLFWIIKGWSPYIFMSELWLRFHS